MEKNGLTLRGKQGIFIWIVIVVSYIGVWLIPVLTKFTGQAPYSVENATILRDTTQFKWYVIPLLLVVMQFYGDEIRNKNWSGILAGLAFVLMDAFNEVWNGLFYTATGGYSAVWMCNWPTSFQSLIGWNIEIMFMFLMLGLLSTKTLPKDKDMKILGINNRHLMAFLGASVCVLVEMVLSSVDALIWNYWWWSTSFPFVLLILAYLPFFMIAYLVYDLPKLKQQVTVVGVMAAVVILSWLIFVPLKWI